MADLIDDVRVQEMARCLLFAINNLKDELVMGSGNLPETMHGWFRKALTDAGFTLTDREPPRPTKKGRKK